MAAFNRSRMPILPFGGGYSKNEFENDRRLPCGYPPMQRYNDYGHSRLRHPYDVGSNSLQRFPGPAEFHHGPHIPGRDIMRCSTTFPARPSPNPASNRMPSPSMMQRQPFQRPDFHRNMSPRMGMPGGGERFFVPWNDKPRPYFTPNPPMRMAYNKPAHDQRLSSQKPSNESVPKKKNKNKKKYNPRTREDAKKLKPWMTDEIYDEVKRKNELFIRAKTEDKPELWLEFKALRNQVSTMIKDAKVKNGFLTPKIKEINNVEKPFSCDTCDRAFVDQEEVDKHMQEHVQCEFEGCFFKAHPKVVELHKRMQHDTGYADAISKLNNKEEIEKWRRERRSHYPTAANVEMRKSELAEKVARGEVLETEQFGKFKRQKFQQNPEPRTDKLKRRNRFKRERRRGGSEISVIPHLKAGSPETVLVDSDSDDSSHINLPKFVGLSILELGVSDKAISDSSNHQSLDPPIVHMDHNGTEHCTENDTLSSVTFKELSPESESIHHMMNTCGSDGDEDDQPSVEPIVKSKEPVHIENEFVQEDTACDVELLQPDSDDEGPSVEPIVKSKANDLDHEEEDNAVKETMDTGEALQQGTSKVSYHQSRRRAAAGERANQNVVNSRSWPSGLKKHNLLDKLLAKEVRHERNIILQCVRHVVNNNFFGLE